MNLNPTRRAARIAGILIFAWLAAQTAMAKDAFDHSHSEFTAILQDHVGQDHLVDYRRLKGNRGKLDQYLKSTASVTQREFGQWSRNQQLAFLLNLYNAATLQLIVDHHPLDSIKDIGFLPGAAWRKDFVRLLGDRIDLNHLEHGIIRPRYKEPRIHFALVCAAMGCPPLRREAYAGSRLEQQLDEQTHSFLGNPKKNRIDLKNGVVHLSSIFDWYQEDFIEASGSVLEYVKGQLPEETRKAMENRRFEIRHLEYDWKLNASSPRQ